MEKIIKLFNEVVAALTQAWDLIDKIWSLRQEYRAFWRFVRWLLLITIVLCAIWGLAYIYGEFWPQYVVRSYFKALERNQPAESLKYTEQGASASKTEKSFVESARSTTRLQRLESLSLADHDTYLQHIVNGRVTFDVTIYTEDYIEPKHLPKANDDPKRLLCASVIVQKQLYSRELRSADLPLTLMRNLNSRVEVVRVGARWRLREPLHRVSDTIFIRR